MLPAWEGFPGSGMVFRDGLRFAFSTKFLECSFANTGLGLLRSEENRGSGF